MMTIERIRELPDTTILSLIACAAGDDYDNFATVLKERGYVINGFSWTKDKNEPDPVDETLKKFYKKEV